MLGKMGLMTDKSCLLCNGGQEVIAHLFFECRYNRECLEELKKWLGWHWKATRLDRILRWIMKTKQGTFEKRVLYAFISAIVYHIWRVRNEVIWDAKLWLANNIVQTIKREMKMRLRLLKPKKIPIQDKVWFESICGKQKCNSNCTVISNAVILIHKKKLKKKSFLEGSLFNIIKTNYMRRIKYNVKTRAIQTGVSRIAAAYMEWYIQL